jgi:hypothetical protein
MIASFDVDPVALAGTAVWLNPTAAVASAMDRIRSVVDRPAEEAIIVKV